MDPVVLFAVITMVLLVVGSMSTLLHANQPREPIGSGVAVFIVVMNILLILDLYLLIQGAACE